MSDTAPATPPALPPGDAPATEVTPWLRALSRHVPFSQMQPGQLARLAAQARLVRFAGGAHVLGPDDGPARDLHVVCEGAVSGVRGITEQYEGSFLYEAGDMFPVAALTEARPVKAVYTALRDTVCLLLPRDEALALAEQSPPFSDVLHRRLRPFVDVASRSLQESYSSEALAEQSMERPLGELCRRTVRTCAPEASIEQALVQMHEARVGSMLVCRADGSPAGILTRHDVLGRIVLPRVPLSAPVSQVMSHPVISLTTGHTAQDAALLMTRHGVRHVPVLEGSRVVGVVSERDLFAMQRLTLRHISNALRAAPDVPTMQAVAEDLREFVRTLLGQGMQAKQLTELISHLNDVLTQRLVMLMAQKHGCDMSRACWLSFGSEGRSEQTIATDQDNGLVFLSEQPEADRPAWLAFARDVNEALDACGYPLCKGNVMASNPECCLTPDEWRSRFARWIGQGTPEDILAANIYFDLRPLAGNQQLADQLREFITQRAKGATRFAHLLAEDLLRARAPLNWLGNIDTRSIDGIDTVDLKMLGTGIFVNVARLQCLALGIPEVNTRRRLEAIARTQHGNVQRAETWVSAFEYLQMLRLRSQLEGPPLGVAAARRPNVINLAALNALDRRILKETFRVARRLQQRVELDHMH